MFARFLHDVANTLKVFEVWDFFSFYKMVIVFTIQISNINMPMF